jgi:F-type H+-transporting ATPase subunit delta
MSIITVARRYAEALADVALARNQVDPVEGELRAFAEIMTSHAELHDVFASPILSRGEKERVLKAILERMRPGKLTENLLNTLLRHDRLHHLDMVYEQFRRELNERRGTVVAEVKTAAPVSPSEQEMLSRKLQQMTGKQVQLRFETDPSLIGGVVTRIGSVVYDGSIRTQLQGIKERLKAGSGVA